MVRFARKPEAIYAFTARILSSYVYTDSSCLVQLSVRTPVCECGSKVDPQGFIDFYAAKGWKIGTSPMKDWKAACRNAEKWERWDKAPAADRNRLRSDSDYQSGNDFFGGG